MNCSFTILALAPSLLLAEPRPPFVVHLDQNTIHEVPIGTETNTLMVFPSEVSLILGHHLTRGETPGKVLCQQAENAKLIVLRQIEEDSKVLMQVVMDESAYVFQLSGSDSPASVIRFNARGQAPPAVEVGVKDLINTKNFVSDKRMSELIRLSQEAAFLKPHLPNEYQGFESRRVSFSSKLGENLLATINGICRFGQEDALVVLGHIRNTGPGSVSIDENSLKLKVGGTRQFSFSQLNLEAKSIPSSGEINFSAVIVGDGNGRPLHLSLKNSFALEANQ